MDPNSQEQNNQCVFAIHPLILILFKYTTKYIFQSTFLLYLAKYFVESSKITLSHAVVIHSINWNHHFSMNNFHQLCIIAQQNTKTFYEFRKWRLKHWSCTELFINANTIKKADLLSVKRTTIELSAFYTFFKRPFKKKSISKNLLQYVWKNKNDPMIKNLTYFKVSFICLIRIIPLAKFKIIEINKIKMTISCSYVVTWK